jgi:hypothetical protein
MKNPEFSEKFVVSLAGGFGNQLFQLANALRQTAPENIKIEVSLGDPKKTPSGLPEIAMLSFEKTFTILESKKITFFEQKTYNLIMRLCGRSGGQLNSLYRVLVGRLMRFISLPNQNIGSIQIENAEVRISKYGDTLSIGYFQNSEFSQNPEVLAFLKKAHLESISDEGFSYINIIQIQNPVILHLRLGDYLSEDLIGIPRVEYFEKAIGFFESRYPECKIWLVTNDVFDAKRYLGEKIFEKLVFDKGLNSLDPLELFEVLRVGRRFIISNSTFSWWAALLSEAKNDVVAPDPWFRKLPQSPKLFPSTWHIEEN